MSKIPSQGILQYQTITRVRRTGGGWYNSRYVEGTEETLEDVQASVQNPTKKGSEIIKNMPEGERLDSWKVLYCDVGTFRISDDDEDYQSDLIVWEDFYWDVRRINTWEGGVLTHDQVFCVRTEREFVPPPPVTEPPVIYSYGGVFAAYSDAFATESESMPNPPPANGFISYGGGLSSYVNVFSGF